MLNFRKIASIIGVVILSACLLAVNVSALGYGDCNRDNDFNVLDIVRAKKFMAHEITEDDISIAAVDFDRNSILEAGDLLKLRKVLLGVESYEDMVPTGDAEWGENWD